MAGSTQTTRFRFWRSLIRLIGVIVPRRFRGRFRQEWEAELQYREELLARWDRLDWRNKLELLWRSLGAFWDALWLQQLRWEDEMIQDLRYGVRMLLKHRGFTLVAVLTLALGIGANTAIFSLIDAVLLKMLPLKNPEQLALLRHANGGKTVTQFPYRTYKQFRDQNQVFSGVLTYHPLRLSVTVDNQPEPAVAGQFVSGNYYSVLGVNVALGRTIVPDDDRAPGESPVCVISYNYWQRRFGSDPAVVGKTIHLAGTPFTIIGVTPPEFFGLEVGSSLDISVPLMMQRQVMQGNRSYVDDDNAGNIFSIMGRLRPGVTMSQAQASLGLLYQQICAEYAASNWGELNVAPYPGSKRS